MSCILAGGYLHLKVWLLRNACCFAQLLAGDNVSWSYLSWVLLSQHNLLRLERSAIELRLNNGSSQERLPSSESVFVIGYSSFQSECACQHVMVTGFMGA